MTKSFSGVVIEVQRKALEDIDAICYCKELLAHVETGGFIVLDNAIPVLQCILDVMSLTDHFGDTRLVAHSLRKLEVFPKGTKEVVPNIGYLVENISKSWTEVHHLSSISLGLESVKFMTTSTFSHCLTGTMQHCSRSSGNYREMQHGIKDVY